MMHRSKLGLLAAFLLLSVPSPLWAQETANRLQRLEERVNRLEELLEKILQRLQQDAADLAGLQQEVVELSAQVASEREERGALQKAPPLQATVRSTAPEDPEEAIINVPYSGYMEVHVNNDGINPTVLDFHRFVLLFGHGFGDRIRFWSELELEHAFVEGGEASGELELEQAYLDFLIHPKLNFRAGMLLTPVGIINERHEPPSFHGVERPFVDTVLIPTTWFGGGAGLVGELGAGFHYKAYVMSSLDAMEFSAASGFRGGRQKGFFENLRNVAWVARVEHRGLPGLNLGTSYWTGETGFHFRDLSGRAHIFEFDGRYQKGRLEGRGQFVITKLDDAALINRIRQQQSGVNPNLAEKMRGFYLESGFHLLPSFWRHDLVAFYRYENFDTQYRMPKGFLPLKQFDRSAHVIGLTYFPFPDIAFKFDYNIMRNASQVVRAPNRWNLGIGWWF